MDHAELSAPNDDGIKVLYVGPLHPNGTCFARCKALRFLHASLDTLDTSFVGQVGSRIYRYLENQICFGTTFLSANQALIRKVYSTRPNVIWIDKGFWIYPRTLHLLRRTGAFLVQHNTDDLEGRYGRWSYRLLRKTVQYYDINFTTNHDNIDSMRAMGAPRVELTALGYDHERFYPVPLEENERRKWSNPIVFVGHWEPQTESYVRAMAAAGLPLKVYGWNWRKARHQKELSNIISPQFLGTEDYVRCLVGAKIGLGFVSKINRNQTAGRSFEIPACGTFLLAQRTEEHQRLYEEGKEADFFSDEDELVEKARFYLADDHFRRHVAERGRQRCLSSEYSWLGHMRRDWAKVCRAVSTAPIHMNGSQK